MLNFNDLPFIDHHCHPYDPKKATLEPEFLAREFFHGMGDIPDPKAAKARMWGATDALRFHFPFMGVVQTLICQLSKVLDCPAELEAVGQARNRISSKSFADYIKLLYKDAGIVRTVLDTGLPINDPLLELMPGKKLRLFQFEPPLDKFLKTVESYGELLGNFQESLENSIKKDGFIGVKVHLAEKVSFDVLPVWEKEAAAVFPKAKAGDAAAYKKIYTAVFTAILLQCQELDVPVHLHSGFTGGTWNGPIHNADPFLLAPFLKHTEFLKTKIVLLHAGFPWTKQAGQMAHGFPHVWVDMGQMTPWASLRIAECYRDVMAWAPLSKIVVGSGGHGTPEIAWLSAKTAKIALAEVLGDAVRLGLIEKKDAEMAGRMILHDNAARLYGLI
ncbi:MAG: amidohydrolase family protein [Desulfobacterales bacterium]|nr:amidohydrolase family protein [Desulfobacterales bacterium]